MYQNVNFIYRLLDSFFRHRWLFVISVITVTGLVMTAMYLRTKKYVATASIQIVPETKEFQQVLGIQPVYDWKTPAQKSINRLNDFLSDNGQGGFLSLVFDQAKTNPPISADPRARDPRYAAFRKGLSLNAQGEYQYGIQLTWDNPQECERLVRAVRSLYIDRIGQEKKAAAIDVTTFLDEEIAKLKVELKRAEDAKTNYEANNQGMLPEQQLNEMERLRTLQMNLDYAMIDLRAAQEAVRSIEAKLKSVPREMIGEARTTYFTTQDEFLLNTYQQERLALIVKNYAETSDKVKLLDEKIAAQKAKIAEARLKNPSANQRVTETTRAENPEYRALSDQLNLARIAVNTQMAQIEVTKKDMASAKAAVAKWPAGKRILQDKTRQYELLQARYNAFVMRRQDAVTKADIDSRTAQASLEEMGSVYAEPTTSSSKVAMMFVGSLVAGILSALMLVVLSEWVDPSVRYDGDVTSIAGVRVMASIVESPDLRALPNPARDIDPFEKTKGVKPGGQAPASA